MAWGDTQMRRPRKLRRRCPKSECAVITMILAGWNEYPGLCAAGQIRIAREASIGDEYVRRVASASSGGFGRLKSTRRDEDKGNKGPFFESADFELLSLNFPS